MEKRDFYLYIDGQPVQYCRACPVKNWPCGTSCSIWKRRSGKWQGCAGVALVFPVLAVIGIINAVNGQEKELPVIGKIRLVR